MNDGKVIRIEDLTLTYRGAAKPALSHIDLAVRPGQITAIIGETGSGKSTLVRAALGLLTSGAETSGTIHVRAADGSDVEPLTLQRRAASAFRRRSIGYVPQLTQRALVPVLTVRRHFQQFDAKTGGGDRKDVEARAAAALERIGLQDPERIMGLYPHQLSGGMAQRVCIALAMFGSARIVVADEPTSGLDVLVRRRVAELLEVELAGADRTMLLVTHDLALAERVATDVAVLFRGRLVESTPAGEFFAEPRHPYSRHLLASIPLPGRELPAPYDPSTFELEAIS